MKKLIVMLIGAFYGLLLSQNLNEIIDYHFDAVKQDKFNQIKTMVIEADLSGAAGSGKLVVYHKRPAKLRIEQIIASKKTCTIYDGENCIQVTDGDSALLSGAVLEDVKFMADLDGYFFCYREKSHDLTFDGTLNEGKKRYFKVVCTKPGGDTTEIFLNTGTYLIEKTVQRREGLLKVTRMDNYKPVNGILFPHKIITVENGTERIQTVKKIVLDSEIPDISFMTR